jgi:predicted ATP-dependent endonuclease of OLD family
MHLKSFRIQNFRSIDDSGDIDVSRITALLGRNESGKSNLLRALHTLNPADGFAALNPTKDFPRHRRLDECTDNTKVVKTVWALNDEEQAELVSIWPRAKGVEKVRIGRGYGQKSRWVAIDVPEHPFDILEVRTLAQTIVLAVKAAAQSVEGQQAELEAAADAFDAAIAVGEDELVWARTAPDIISELREALNAAIDSPVDELQTHLDTLETWAETVQENDAKHRAARSWVLNKLPLFIYLDEYPEIEGHQNIESYLLRQQNSGATDADRNFQKLCKVAGLKPDQLQELFKNDDREKRSQLANRAGAVVTQAIRTRWKDRQLKVRFNLDGYHFDTLISDPNATYDVEVNLDERSRGFQWFFAFYVVFAADTDGGDADNAVLLLDEPGLYLHAKSQGDLLRQFENDFANQILYTTHSPFMVPTHKLSSVRTVNITEDQGTTVSNDPTGDASTLFPLQAALGYDVAQSLFIGLNNLVVEGVTDFWVLSAVSDYLREKGKCGLHSEIIITPAGGAQKLQYMVALLTSQQLNVIVLFDDEKDAKTTRDEIVRGKLIRDDNVIFVSSAFPGNVPSESDIEDVLDPAVYEALVRESYERELNGKELTLNDHIPRIAKRVELGLERLGIVFHKTRPTRLFLTKMATDPTSVLPPDSIERFERLFEAVNTAFGNHVKRDGKPFGRV